MFVTMLIGIYDSNLNELLLANAGHEPPIIMDEDNNFSKENFKTLVNGYHEVRPLSEKELNSLPVLCSGSALRFLLTRVDNWNSSKGIDIVNYQDPREFLERLNFHSKIDDLKGYGI